MVVLIQMAARRTSGWLFVRQTDGKACRICSGSFSAEQFRECICRRGDLNPKRKKLFGEHQQIVVTRDQKPGSGCNGCMDEFVVIRNATAAFLPRGNLDPMSDQAQVEQEFFAIFHADVPVEFRSPYPAFEFGKSFLAEHRPVVRDDMPCQLRRSAFPVSKALIHTLVSMTIIRGIDQLSSARSSSSFSCVSPSRSTVSVVSDIVCSRRLA